MDAGERFGLKIVVVRSPHSGSAGSVDIAAVRGILLQTADEVDVVEPGSEDTFSEEVRSAAADASVVVAVGGDGTFNLVVNALEDRTGDVAFGLLPTGTGNDLARTLNLPDDVEHAARAVAAGRERWLDIGRARGDGVDRLFVNACIGGLPVAVDENVTPGIKTMLGPIAFLAGGVRAMASFETFSAVLDGNEVPDCVAVDVGNGKTCGGGIPVWPEAVPDDGLLDGCALPAAGPVAGVKLATKLRTGALGDIDEVMFSRGRKIEIGATPAVEINLDGELVGLQTPASFEIVSRLRIRVPG
ncbi:MAG: YegS/Rv2252/BmrU family lipid kinase [Actinomycetota bacterium]|nr:YegS/Rv2252/BmrU family lipid kinase [Actinomycetota bacterium]